MSGEVPLSKKALPELVSNYAAEFAKLRKIANPEKAKEYVTHLFRQNELGENIFGEQVDVLSDYQVQFLKEIEGAKKCTTRT